MVGSPRIKQFINDMNRAVHGHEIRYANSVPVDGELRYDAIRMVMTWDRKGELEFSYMYVQWAVMVERRYREVDKGDRLWARKFRFFGMLWFFMFMLFIYRFVVEVILEVEISINLTGRAFVLSQRWR